MGNIKKVSSKAYPSPALVYTILMTLAPSLAFGPLVDISSDRYMKEVLASGPASFALIGILVGLPQYFAPLLGYVRDRWSPFGQGDRGFFLLFAPLAAVGYFIIALGRPTLPFFIVGALIVVASGVVVGVAVMGAQALLARRSHKAGSIVTAVLLVGFVAGALVNLGGGWAATHLPYKTVLIAMGIACFAIALAALYRPRNVPLDREPLTHKRSPIKRDILRLLTHRPFLVAVAIAMAYQISPIGSAAIIYFITDHLKGNIEDFGRFIAIGTIANYPGTIIYGLLQTRFSLRKILFWSIAVTAIQFVPLLFAHSLVTLYVCGGLAGFIGSISVAAIFNLRFDTCPVGLESSALTVCNLGSGFVITLSGLLGAWLFERYGLLPGVILNGVASIAMLPLVWLVPRYKAAEECAAETSQEPPASRELILV
jgi:MFS family permease